MATSTLAALNAVPSPVVHQKKVKSSSTGDNSQIVTNTVLTTATTPPPTFVPVHGSHNSHADTLTFTVPVVTPGPNGAQCSIWSQDCPKTYKCIAESLDKVPKCRRLDDNPDQVGDECSTKDNNDGDTCDKDGMCINGVCQPLCRGTPQNPNCPDQDQFCHIYSKGTPLCEYKCHPLLHGVCNSAMKYCTVDSGSPDQRFSCMHKTGEQLGMNGDSCTETSQCRQGFACVSKGALPNGFCDNNSALSCCTMLVYDDEPEHCEGGTVSQPFYPPNSAPPGLGDLHVCLA